MSKERARRRAVRDAEAAPAAARAEQQRLAQVRRRQARAGRARALRRSLGLRPVRVRSATRRATARRWAPLLALLVAAHVALWLLTDDWGLRLAALGVTALAAPVVWVLVTDSARGRGTGYRRRP